MVKDPSPSDNTCSSNNDEPSLSFHVSASRSQKNRVNMEPIFPSKTRNIHQVHPSKRHQQVSKRSKFTHHQVSNDHDQHEDQDAERLASDLHAVPHGLYPLATQHPEDNEEGVEEVLHVPARERTVL